MSKPNRRKADHQRGSDNSDSYIQLKHARQVLDLLREEPNASEHRLAAHLGVVDRTMKRFMDAMRDNGFPVLKVQLPDKSWAWKWDNEAAERFGSRK